MTGKQHTLHLPTGALYDSTVSCGDNKANWRTHKKEKVDSVKSKTAQKAENMFTSYQIWQDILFVLALAICYDYNIQWSSYLEISESFLFQMAWANLRGHNARGCTQHAGTQTWTQTVSAIRNKQQRITDKFNTTLNTTLSKTYLEHNLKSSIIDWLIWSLFFREIIHF